MRKNYIILLPIGLLSALVIIFQMIAISMAFVVYVISIKRMSTALSVLWGSIFLKEIGLKERLTGVLIMIIGVLFIAII